jgi:hypothetical protein
MFRRLFMVAALIATCIAWPAFADTRAAPQPELSMGVGWVVANKESDALDGVGLRLSLAATRRRGLIGLLVDAQTGTSRRHFMKEGSVAALLLLGASYAYRDSEIRPSFRFGAGRLEQHFTDQQVVVYSPALGIGLEMIHWEKDWLFGLDVDGRCFLMPMTHTQGDTSGAWMVTQLSLYLTGGRRF